jgi:hypothetical protein
MSWKKHVDPADARLIWAFGKPYQFHWVTVWETATNRPVPLDPTNYGGGSAAGQRFQKSQIVLHGTESNNESRGTLDHFHNGPLQPGNWRAAAHIVVERTRSHTVPWSAADGVPPRASRAGIARLHPDAVLDDGDDYVDVVRLADLNEYVIHGSSVNKNAIGIEHVNAQDNFHLAKDETKDPATQRPRDLNRWIRIGQAGSAEARGDMQAFEEEQYNSVILMLRAICIEQRIPRQFFGDTWEEKSSHYSKWAAGPGGPSQADRREKRSRLFRFRGLIQHWNTEVKLCPGSLALNRIFRGIIDEWWLPVELGGYVRPYYSGPFWVPTFVPPDNAGRPSKPAWFRWMAGLPPHVDSDVYHDVDLDALTETRSYFDLDELEKYYVHCETEQGGLFPVGHNGIWHGGVHLEPDDANPVVYAAASGTIVAARLSSNPMTDAEPGYGSQRFLLIRHAVHWKTEPVPNAPASSAGERINYAANPSYVFSLYMHLDAIPDLFREHAENPRWYNKWLREKAKAANPWSPDEIPPFMVLEQEVGMTSDGEKGKVFNPGIEVSVGDVLGVAGRFSQWFDPSQKRRMIHFEVISHRDEEITLAGERRADDTDQNVVCDVNVINRELAAIGSEDDKMTSVVAPKLRNLRVRHRSSWSWDRPDLLAGVASFSWVQANWPHLLRMMWVQDALAANSGLKTQLGDSNLFWHYHPITFMAAMNRLILGENRELVQAPLQGFTPNVEVDENYFLTEYVDFLGGTLRPANADNQRLKPYEFENTGFSITRAELACRASASAHPLPHFPNPIPQSTYFSLALLEVYERVRVRLNAPLTITCASVCPGHMTEVERCCRNDVPHFQAHQGGTAIDFHPVPTLTTIQNLWQELRTVRDAYNAEARRNAGTACHGNLPSGFGGVEFKAQDDGVMNKLEANPPQALTNAEISSFCVHLALVPV